MKKILLFSIIILTVFGCSGQDKTMNEKKFTKEYRTIVSKKYPQVKFEIKSSLILKATYGEEGEATLFLDNAYREYKMNINDFDQVIERYTSASADMFQEKSKINKNRIVPIIKPDDYFEQLRSLSSSIKDYKILDFIWEKYNEDLIIVYAEDRDDNINYFNKKEFEQLNIDRDSLLEFSLNNLNRIIPKIEKIGGKGNYELIAGGNYEVSLILMQFLWTKENFDVNGDIIIAIPNRDLLFITGSNDVETIEKLKKTIRESYINGNHSISKNFYKWNGINFRKYH